MPASPAPGCPKGFGLGTARAEPAAAAAWGGVGGGDAAESTERHGVGGGPVGPAELGVCVREGACPARVRAGRGGRRPRRAVVVRVGMRRRGRRRSRARRVDGRGPQFGWGGGARGKGPSGAGGCERSRDCASRGGVWWTGVDNAARTPVPIPIPTADSYPSRLRGFLSGSTADSYHEPDTRRLPTPIPSRPLIPVPSRLRRFRFRVGRAVWNHLQSESQ